MLNRGRCAKSAGCLLNFKKITWVLIQEGGLKNAGGLIRLQYVVCKDAGSGTLISVLSDIVSLGFNLWQHLFFH